MNNKDYAPPKFDITVYRGATYRRTFTVRYKALPAEQFFVNGDRAKMEMRADGEEGDVLYTLTTENGNIMIDTTNQLISLLIPHQQTREIADSTTGLYDLEIWHSPTHPRFAGEVTIILRGKVKLVNNITRLAS